MLSRIQKIIERIYDVETFLNVEDYVIEEPLSCCLMTKPGLNIGSSSSKGCIFISQIGKDLEITVYIDRETVSNLKGHNVMQGFHRKDISDFFIAAEEVSHFVYAVWSAIQRRQITIFEMELQAEVDKYITAILYSGSINKGKIPAMEIKKCLFEDSILQPDLQPEEKERYKSANRLAMNYCHYLESNYLKKNDLPSMLRDIRHFYRLGQNGKISRINSITFH